MKKILTLALILLSLSLFAKTEKLDINGDIITLNFDNVKVKSIKFYSGEKIVVKYSEKDVLIENDGKNLIFNSEFSSSITLKLPEDLVYEIKKDGAVAKFSNDYFVVNGDDGEIVTFKEGSLHVVGDDNEKVIISEDGIFVNDNGDIVEISKKGIKIQNSTEDEEYSGFWGKLAGSVIRSVANASINYASKRPEKIAKWMINEDNDYEGNIKVSWANDSEDEEVEKEEEYMLKTFSMVSGEEVYLKNINGNIEVSKWTGDVAKCEIEMKTRYGKKELEKVEINFITDGQLSIETIRLEKKARVTVNYKIMLPDYVQLKDVITSNGYIEIENLSVNGDLSSSNGSVKVLQCKGDIDIDTSNGEVRIENHKGKVKANTSNGRVTAFDITGAVEIYTNNGSVSVEECPFIQSMITSNAKVNLVLEEMNNDVTIKTSNGSIRCIVNPDLDIDINASTSNSSVNVEDLSLAIDSKSSSRLRAKLNSGKYSLTLTSSNGKINIQGDEKLF